MAKIIPFPDHAAAPAARDGVPALAELEFRYPFRRYQRMVLDLVDGQMPSDHKYHIVAPPGAGKTIVGLELIRRFGQPAVVFCPTTTIQQQWQEKVGLFADPQWLADHTSVDAGRLSTINVLTYQVLSTPGEHLEFVRRIAIERWVDDLLKSDKARTEREALQRIATLEQANRKAHKREIAKRYRRVKREFLHDGTLNGQAFLHPNARDLIARIVALGTGTVVLDECHHLLDYWAFILRELIKALPQVRVVGLTATLPDPSNPVEFENYDSLLGEVDFEVPTPAVVKEGNLAPYRDLVYFCQPSTREQSYLEDIQKHFEAAIWQTTQAATFQDWLWEVLFPQRAREAQQAAQDQAAAGEQAIDELPEANGPASPLLERFERAFRREPDLCIAAVKYLLELRVPLPLELPLIDDMMDPLGVADWLVLMENYGLRVLKVSPDPGQQALLRDLRDALLPFGITITERGIRHQRSPVDLVLALSESKDEATLAILRAESEAMGDKLRALVLTDYERLSARTRRLKGILDPDAGSAVRVFWRLVTDPTTRQLAPVLVTGKMVMAGAHSCDLLDEGMRRWMNTSSARIDWAWKETESEQVVRLEGTGRDWGSRTYVAMFTDLFDEGLTRCLVGTRGIFGEGWDAVRLNTLLDMTSVTTRTSVQQIRGRPIRLDPQWQRKVAHNWDVVCLSKTFDRGDADLVRFATRHAHTWGLVIPPSSGGLRQTAHRAALEARAEGVTADALREEGEGTQRMAGRIVRGVAHVDLQLALELAANEFKRLRTRGFTRRMLQAVWERDRVYDLWGVGQPYENAVFGATQIEPRDVTYRTTATVQQSLGAISRRLLTSVVVAGGVAWFSGALLLPWAEMQSLLSLGVGLTALTGTAALATVGLNLRRMGRLFRQTFLELPADAVLMDMGHALLAALGDTGAVAAGLKPDCVRIVETAMGNWEVMLDNASEEDSAIFAAAFQQMMGPLADARYLIERDGTSLRNWVYRPLWLAVRSTMDLDENLVAYHRVPDVLASRRERADALARHWQRTVGGGRLVYTRTAEGRRILLQARAQQHEPVHLMGFTVWR